MSYIGVAVMVAGLSVAVNLENYGALGAAAFTLGLLMLGDDRWGKK